MFLDAWISSLEIWKPFSVAKRKKIQKNFPQGKHVYFERTRCIVAMKRPEKCLQIRDRTGYCEIVDLFPAHQGVNEHKVLTKRNLCLSFSILKWDRTILKMFLLSFCDRSAKMHFHEKQKDRQNVLVIKTDIGMQGRLQTVQTTAILWAYPK